MNTGKRFEQNFRISVPEGIYFFRFRDNSSSWGGNNAVRFTYSNICDCMLYDGNYLYLLELKSTKGSSLPFTNIRKNQLEELLKASKYKNIVAGFIINFSTKDRCFFLSIDNAIEFINTTSRKSFPIDYLELHGIEIEVIKKKVNSTYNVNKFIENIREGRT